MNIEQKAWNRVTTFLDADNFNGFTAEDLFIKRFIPKAWGQDIASLSNMAEAIRLKHLSSGIELARAQQLMREVAARALHRSVSPYFRKIESVNDLGRQGYYLEHLNIILGVAYSLGVTVFEDLNVRVSRHLQELSLGEGNAHAPLMPHVKMRWSADQAAILNSLWLFDQNQGTDLHEEPARRWLSHMKTKMTDAETGLFETEAMRVKRYSRQPRGCSMAYMIHYMSSFAPEIAFEQWSLFKSHMLDRKMGLTGFREYLPGYKGNWTPDSGPVISGVGIAATGLGAKAARTVGDVRTHSDLRESVGRVIGLCGIAGYLPGLSTFTSIGTDLLASAIYSNAID